ncbi:MAG: rane dipeptidase [Thermomicrobiales bacterium]|nr:rane dipeptidase [Thermomicrobiales bacterium]
MGEQNGRAVPIFDGHNDTVLSLRHTGRSFFERSETGHVDLPRAKAGGMAGGFFAVWIPDPSHTPPPGQQPDPDVSAYSDVSRMPPQMGVEYAQNNALGSLAILIRQVQASQGEVEIVTTAADLRRCVENGTFAIELHLEGAEPIDQGLDALEVYARAGVRSVGIVWSRSNAFGHGVPFKFGQSPDTGPGLTDAGKELVRNCNRLGVLVDVSHLNEAGFWDVAGLTEDPIVATHSGVHALCPSTRNLTDKQLDAIHDSEGIVGVNFHVGFLRPDGKELPAETTVAAIADHVDYLANRLGIDKVALGSDFDGATMPGDLRDVAGLPLLIAELRTRGYDNDALCKIGYENWLRIFERTWNA